MDHRTALIAGAAVALLTGGAHAGLTGVQQMRSIAARTTVGSVTDGPEGATAIPFALFDEGVTTAASTMGGSGGAAAGQVSEFRADRVVGQGSASSSAGGSLSFYEIRAASVFDLVFGVDTATDITVLSSVSGTGVFDLREEGGAVLLSGSGVLNTTLGAGVRYRLTASAGAALDATGTQGGGYSFQMIGVPTPGAIALLGVAGGLGARRRR